jgi:hypothetical protein
MAVLNGSEVKLLYTTKFYPGHFSFLAGQRFNKVAEVTAHCELEKASDVVDLRGRACT